MLLDTYFTGNLIKISTVGQKAFSSKFTAINLSQGNHICKSHSFYHRLRLRSLKKYYVITTGYINKSTGHRLSSYPKEEMLYLNIVKVTTLIVLG